MLYRRPQSAPRCPKCGYSLFRLPELRCPECGYVIENTGELERARWLADDNAQNRAAVRREWLLAGVGVVFILAGIALAVSLSVSEAMGSPFATAGLIPWRWTCVGAIATAGYIVYRRYIGEPMYRALFVLGLAWLAYGVLALAIW